MSGQAVVRVDALCACEGCGKRFGVELDVAEELKGGAYADFDALVRDAILGGQATVYTWGVRGKATVDRYPLSYNATVQADLVLCDICSKKCDELPIEGALTLSQVEQAIAGTFELGDDED
jgi:hypothetical protein